MATIVTLTTNPALDIATATDRVVPSHKLRCDRPQYDPGGVGINVARAVHALGGAALKVGRQRHLSVKAEPSRARGAHGARDR
jgi:fructose-1-phosphate kinase PfkB-like protein